MGGTRGVFFLSIFLLPLSPSITLSIITPAAPENDGANTFTQLCFSGNRHRRRRSAVARVTTTLLLKPRRGTTERERVL